METNDKIKCNFIDCNKQFKSQRILNRHLLTHSVIKIEDMNTEEEIFDSIEVNFLLFYLYFFN